MDSSSTSERKVALDNEGAVIGSPVFFLHIPKCGGMSLRDFIRNQYPEKLIFPFHEYGDFKINANSFKKYAVVMGHFDARIVEFIPSTFPKITFLREPISRTLSAIAHFVRENWKDKNLTVRDVINDASLLNRFGNSQTSVLTKRTGKHDFSRAGFDELDRSANSVPSSLELLSTFSFIGLVETYRRDLTILSSLLNWCPPRILSQINVNYNAEQEYRINEAELNLLRRENEEDINLYESVRHWRKLSQTSYIDIGREACFFYSKRMALPRSSTLSLLPPFHGWGFHATEYSEAGAPFRWSGPGTKSGVTLKLEDEGRIILTISYWLNVARYATQVSIFVNGEFVDIPPTQDGKMNQISFECDPSNDQNGLVEIIFEVDRVARSEKEDLRKLGFLLTEVRWEPVEPLDRNAAETSVAT